MHDKSTPPTPSLRSLCPTAVSYTGAEDADAGIAERTGEAPPEEWNRAAGRAEDVGAQDGAAIQAGVGPVALSP